MYICMCLFYCKYYVNRHAVSLEFSITTLYMTNITMWKPCIMWCHDKNQAYT